MNTSSAKPKPVVLAFDVFGTVVDWHHSIAREVDALGLPVAGGEFANAWRARYQPSMQKVRSGELPWTKIDDLHRMNLDEVLEQLKIDSLDAAARDELNRAWHRLKPWPDTVEGLTKLKQRFTLCTLSNGNLGLLANMAKNGGLPWDLILSAEVFRHYKPDPETYLGVCEVFAIEPPQMMMVAAHKNDLQAAAACGCQTAFIARPLEFGAGETIDTSPESEFDYNATDMIDLARQMAQ
ncbi:MAG: haloacid dehalogenase type II [Burkholderiaceae bacterium]